MSRGKRRFPFKPSLTSSGGLLVAYLGFVDEVKAAAFERYLKSVSGRAFAAKRFW
jgi:hypothetical protein